MRAEARLDEQSLDKLSSSVSPSATTDQAPSRTAVKTRDGNAVSAADTKANIKKNPKKDPKTSAKTSSKTTPQKSLSGAITGLHDGVLQGWACCADEPDLCLVIEVYFDGVYGQLTRADEFAMYAPDQARMHGFSLTLHSNWLATAKHISARVANQGPWLVGAIDLEQQKTQVLPNEAASRVYYAGGLKLVGWALPDAGAIGPKAVQVIEGETRIAQVHADQHVGFLSNRTEQGHGFEVDLPWSMADGKRHLLEVLDLEGSPIKGSPLEVCVSETSMASLVRDSWPKALNQNPPEGLLALIQTHERIYPASFGFVHYPHWYELYQQPPAFKNPQQRVAVLVIAGSQQAELAQVSIDSVFEQRLPAEQIDCLQVTPTGILQGLREASEHCDLVVPIWAGDRLAPHALDTMAMALIDSANPATLTGWGYSDCDTVTVQTSEEKERIHRFDPWLKPDWDETLFFGMDYISPGVFMSAALVKETLSNQAASLERLMQQAMQSGQPQSVWHAFLACLVAQEGSATAHAASLESITTASKSVKAQSPKQIHKHTQSHPIHLKQVLYHRGDVRYPGHQNTTARQQNITPREASLAWLAEQRCPGAHLLPVHSAQSNTDQVVGWRVVWPMPVQKTSSRQPKQTPRVSVIVPTRNGYALLKTVMDGLLQNTDYSSFEVLVVDNDSDCPDTLEYLAWLQQQSEVSLVPGLPRIRVLSYPHPFNYAAINNFAAEEANGELLLLLNNDVEITDSRWLSEMVVQFGRADVGVVGKKLLWPNGMVQHGGVVVGINGLAAHAFNDCQSDDPGYMGLNQFDREQSAVTAACLMVRREDFLGVGGFDAEHLPVAFNDVDLCLKLRGLGKKVVLTTRFPLIHHESATRGKEDTPEKLARARRERDYFIGRWMPIDRFWTDPYYHPGLNHDFASGPYGGLGRIHPNTSPNNAL